MILFMNTIFFVETVTKPRNSRMQRRGKSIGGRKRKIN
jgi:hypothetical protein